MAAVVTLHWCKQQKRGIKLIDPNDNLAKEYMQTAEETLDVLRTIRNKSKVWLATTKYYCEYFAMYSLFMKCGIESEIHDCTICLCTILEQNSFVPLGYSKILEDDKQLRIDNQYYLKNRDVPFHYDALLDFILQIKEINAKLTHEKIQKIRKLVSER